MGYPMSYIEFFGTLFNLWSVWLVAKNRISTWPVGIVGVLLFLVLFYQVRLYSDTFEQVYYLIASVYGWWLWASASDEETNETLPIKYSSPRVILLGIMATVAISIVMGRFVSQIHILFPVLFPEKASYPYLDALTTIMSFTAMLLLAQKRIESWIYWIIVDIIGIGLYYVKNVKFIALLYLIFLIMATNGLVLWIKESKEERAS
jgi:nicotinamide mononucleotide transporter